MNDMPATPPQAHFNKAKRFFWSAISLLIVVVAAFLFIKITNTGTQGVGPDRNWNADAILAGGAITEKELLDAYDKNAAGIKAIYAYYGLSRDDLAGKTSTIVHGRVHRDGTITRFDTGQIIARNARSVARSIFYDANGNGPTTIKVSDGTTLYEGPNMSIFRRDVDAFLFYRDGQFYKGIISSCGNPVVGEPTEPKKPKPVYKCENLTATRLNRTEFRFTAKATAKNGAELKNYTFNFGDGSAPLTTTDATVTHTFKDPKTYPVSVTANILVDGNTKAESAESCKTSATVDQPPKELVHTCDSLKATKISRDTFSFRATATVENGPKIESYTFNFGDGSAPYTSTSPTATHTYKEPNNYTATVTANIKVGNESKAITGKECQTPVEVEKPPLYRCDSLKAAKINRTKFAFTTEATALYGAKIVSYTYNFNDGATKTVASKTIDHTFTKPGSHTVTVTVTMEVDGETKQVTSANCQTKVTVDEPPKAPVYTCDLLKANPVIGKERTYEFVLTYTAESGATLDSATYNFGDGTPEVTLKREDAALVEHQFAEPGNYTIAATLHFTVTQEGKTSQQTANCKTDLTVPKPETCPLPGKEHLPKNSPDCSEPAEVPEELPQTGIGAWLSGGIGLAALAGAGYYWHVSHNTLRDTRLKKK